MRSQRSVAARALLSVTMVLFGVCDRGAAQDALRGLGSRGINPLNAPRHALTPRVTRPMNNQTYLPLPANANAGGPLDLDATPALNGPAFFFFDAPALNGAGDATRQGDLGFPGGSPPAGLRPSVRPRLNIADREATPSWAVLQQIRAAVNAQIAHCAEKPLSPAWFAAHGAVAPIDVQGGNTWSNCSWSNLQALIGADATPQRYDFRPDSGGLIFVYRDGVRRERAVDARQEAAQLARTPAPAEPEPPGLSLGVFAAVPPIEAPVQALLQLVVSSSGTVSGYEFHFATDSAKPLRGAVDRGSQRAAWQVENGVMEAGLVNLTEDVGRALLFRDDGWTQPWILMRVPDASAGAAAPAARRDGVNHAWGSRARQ